MPKFRTKPVEIEAVQWDGNTVPVPIPYWFAQSFIDKTIDRAQADRTKLNIKTLEVWMQASAGDWIIRGVKGEIYACKPDIFAETYEPVEPAIQGEEQQ